MLIAFDRDATGERGAEALAERLMAVGIEALSVQFPRGMDANEYAKRMQPAAHVLGMVLRQARWLGRGMAAKAPAPVEPEPVIAPESEPPSLAAAPAAAEPPEAAGDELQLRLGACQWRVHGWRKNVSPEQMRVNLLVRREDGAAGGFHVDTLDLYQAKARAVYLRQASIELGQPEEDLKRSLGELLLKVELLQDEALRAAQAPKSTAPVLTVEEEREALALLRLPDLAPRIVADLQACGVVGEATNLLAGYLAATSRKLAAPLAVLIQSSSAAGKSSLMDAVLTMMPPKERIQYSAMTGQSLFWSVSPR